MVKGILADVHMIPEVEGLVRAMQQEPWAEFWEDLGLTLYRFDDIALKPTSMDREIWQRCQDEEMVFITNNRNEKTEDSLETTLRLHNTPDSLPVFTISNLGKFRKSQTYANRVVRTAYEYLLNIDRVRGAGRLYLP